MDTSAQALPPPGTLPPSWVALGVAEFAFEANQRTASASTFLDVPTEWPNAGSPKRPRKFEIHLEHPARAVVACGVGRIKPLGPAPRRARANVARSGAMPLCALFTLVASVAGMRATVSPQRNAHGLVVEFVRIFKIYARGRRMIQCEKRFATFAAISLCSTAARGIGCASICGGPQVTNCHTASCVLLEVVV